MVLKDMAEGEEKNPTGLNTICCPAGTSAAGKCQACQQALASSCCIFLPQPALLFLRAATYKVRNTDVTHSHSILLDLPYRPLPKLELKMIMEKKPWTFESKSPSESRSHTTVKLKPTRF